MAYALGGDGTLSIGVVVADDHPIVLAGLAQLLGGEPALTVLALCTRGAEALAAVAQYQPEVLLLDVSLPDRDGIDMLPEIASLSPETRTVMFAALIEEERVVAALHEGAKAVVFKNTPAAELVACIRLVAAGAEWITPAGAEDLAADADQRRPFDRAALLSPREREIAERVARGARNKEIAWELGLAEGTVKLHISRAFKRLGIGNRVSLSRIIAGSRARRAEAGFAKLPETALLSPQSPASNWGAGLPSPHTDPLRPRGRRGSV